MKNRNIVIFLIALCLMVVAVLSLGKNFFSPYVSFNEAKKKHGQYVQIIGQLKKSVPVSFGAEHYSFTLFEKDNSEMPAIHKGPKPQNFEHADQVVLIGTYDKSRELFIADKVLVKCPSKYERKSSGIKKENP